MKKVNLIEIAGACGVLLPIIVFLFLIFALIGAPWFNWTNNALSDLGVSGISAFLFNYGIIVGGILCLIFSIGFSKKLDNKIGSYLLVISSIALIGVGLFPATLYVIHLIWSSAFFIFINLAFFVIGYTLIKNKFEVRLGKIAISFALIACVSPVFLLFLDGIAIPEAFSFFPAFIWCMLYGFKLLKEEEASELLL